MLVQAKNQGIIIYNTDNWKKPHSVRNASLGRKQKR